MIRKLLLMNVSIFVMVFAASSFGVFKLKEAIPQGPADNIDFKVLSSRKEREKFVVPTVTVNRFSESFDESKTIEESSSMKNSRDAKWWLNSGAYVYQNNGVGTTVVGELSTINKWRLAYYLSNPTDTDDGYHPQNILRLVTRSSWQNFSQQVYFKIIKDNLSQSPQRNGSNGLLLFNRYQDGQTLYYTGVRVDGGVVIKKKLNGEYYTMAYKKYFSGTFNNQTNPNLLPKNTWIGLKSEVMTLGDGRVSIRVYLDLQRTGKWELVLESFDAKGKFGDQVISNRGYAGIRTDFMDVAFDDFLIEEK